MQRSKNKKIVISISLILMMLLITDISEGEELTFEQALNQGLQSAGELRAVRENINSLKRTLSSLSARQDWQVELGAHYNHIFGEGNNQLTNNNGSSLTQNNVTLGISRSFASGLTLSPVTITLTEEGDTDFSVEANYPLYPLTPTETKRQIYKTEKELRKAELSLLQKQADLILSWLESYLNLCRIIDKEKIYMNNLTKAEENLQEVQQRHKLGEAGKHELLTARLGVKEAEYALEERERQIEQAKSNLINSLALDEKQDLKLDISPAWYQALTQQVDELTTKYLDKTDLIKVAAANNYDLYANRLNQEILQQELVWLQQESNTSINLSSSYNSTRDEVVAGISVSHKLYDGGQQQLEVEKKEAEIKSAREDYDDILQGIKDQLKEYQNKIELSEMKLNKEKLALEKSQFEAEIFQEQLDRGLLDYLEYQEKWLTNRETGLNFKSLQDQLLLDKLKLIAFVDTHEITGGLFDD